MPNVAKLELIFITTYCVIIQCFSKCPEACVGCEGDACYACEDGYFLYLGVCPQCPLTCRICQSQDICTDCQPNFWNLTFHCGMQCPSNCLSGCEVATGNCFGCKSNFYGQDCAHDCTLCRYGNCNIQGCTSGCQDGYFQDSYQGYSVCRQCSPNCSKCGTFYNCTECKPHFHLYEYSAFNERHSECKQCSPGCAICTDIDRCLSCEHINHCKECKYNGTAYTCFVCENGYTIEGDQCFTERKCPVGCLNGCDIRGVCYLCKTGFTGLFCNNSCSEFCLRCSKDSPHICEQCKDPDRFTPKCTEHCSEYCSKINGISTCPLDNGYCVNGCRAGRWGTKCENNCSINCMKNKNSQPDCNVLTGSCTYGCRTGFTGSACDIITTDTETINTTLIPNVREPNDAKVKTFPLAAVLGALAGGIVFGAASVVVVFVLWKRLRKTPQLRSHFYENAGIDISQHADNPTSSIELSVSSSETSVYEHLSGKTNENNYSVLKK